MKKITRLLSSSLLFGLIGVTLFSCSNDNTPDSGNNGGQEQEPVGITKLPENDFDNDPNRHDRQPVEKTLTLKGGATFADGTTSKVFLSNTELVVGTDILVTIPEGKIITGWLSDDPDNSNYFGDYYPGSNFVTIRKDATIQPIFDIPSEGYAATTVPEGSTPTYGKISGMAWEQRTDDPQTSQNAYICKDTLSTINVNNEAGVYFHIDGGTTTELNEELKVPAGWHTMFLSKYQVIEEYSYGINYYVQNYGDEAVDIKLYQTNSSTNVLNEANASTPIHLEPGEVGTVFTSFTGWKNGNTLVTLESLTAVDELKVGICGYIVDYETVENVTLTLTEGDILESGESIGLTKDYKPGNSVTLSSDNVDISEDDLFIGWKNAGDEGTVYPSSFNMPNMDLNLSPYTEKKADHTHTVTLGEGLTFNDETTSKDLVWNDTLDLADIQYSGEVRPGQRIIYTINADGVVSELNALEDLTMPDCDVTISFARTEVVYSTTNGKIGMAPFASDAGNNPHKWRPLSGAPHMISRGDININGSYTTDYSSICYASKGLVEGEEASIFDLVGWDQETDSTTETIQPGALFSQQLNHNIIKGIYNDVATVQNLGEKTISIRLHITRSSGDYDKNASSEIVTIEPNQVVEIPYVVNFDANNSSEMISIEYAGGEAIANMKLGIFIYRSPAEATK